MKKLFYILSAISFLAFSSCSGDIFDNIEEHTKKEKVYVGKYDKADIKVGIKRVEIDLLDAGRIPKEKVKIGKAVKTIVEYDNKEYPCEVQSWLNITGLTEPRMYRIKVYNVDEFGNRSIPVEATAIPFTDVDTANLVVPVPSKLLAPVAAQFNWANGLTSDFFDFYEMEYSYINAQKTPMTLKSRDSANLTVMNLAEGSAGVIDLTAKVVPKQNGIPILDTVYLKSSIEYQLPTKQQYIDARSHRKIKNTYLADNKATVTFDKVPEHLAISELTYETVAGTFNTLKIAPKDSIVECPNAKRDVLYKMRSGFLPPGTTDTLYKDWITSKVPFLTLPTGTYKVDPMSY
ncbi:MAG: DUF4998 domain-containing protein, partial [Tannerella sp.]|nr:DUF4998 domain-containing protein [Tannerella sp.]